MAGAPGAAEARLEEVVTRVAEPRDLPQLVAMLADDFLGRQREVFTDPPADCYVEAFTSIAADPNNEIIVACVGDRVVASLQLTFTPSLSYQGSVRATVESVRTAAALRSRGIGSALMRDASERARARGCRMVQLTTNRQRPDAKRFYERLGFEATHDGMKLMLKP